MFEKDNDNIEISYFKSSGPGGQKKNVTQSAVRIRHVPTGIVVVATKSRSQHRNREIAMAELHRRLAERNKRRKSRVPTRPSKASRTKRLEMKKQRSMIKKTRRGVSSWE